MIHMSDIRCSTHPVGEIGHFCVPSRAPRVRVIAEYADPVDLLLY